MNKPSQVGVRWPLGRYHRQSTATRAQLSSLKSIEGQRPLHLPTVDMFQGPRAGVLGSCGRGSTRDTYIADALRYLGRRRSQFAGTAMVTSSSPVIVILHLSAPQIHPLLHLHVFSRTVKVHSISPTHTKLFTITISA